VNSKRNARRQWWVFPVIAMGLGPIELQGSTALEPTKAEPAVKAERKVPMTLTQLDPELRPMVEAAIADLRKRQGPRALAAEDIDVLRAERVTWRSNALGCRMPDRGYLMVLSPGVLIELQARGASYEYHGARKGTPFLCEPPGVVETPAPGGNSRDPT